MAKDEPHITKICLCPDGVEKWCRPLNSAKAGCHKSRPKAALADARGRSARTRNYGLFQYMHRS